MAILNLPSTPAFKDCEWRLSRKTAKSDSVFTGQSSVYIYPNNRWTGTVKLPPMSRAQAQPWLAFIANLRGRSGMFFMGNPDAKYGLGKATNQNATATCQTTGSSNLAGDTAIDVSLGQSFYQSQVWAAGDFISFTNGTDDHEYIHMVTEDMGYGGSGMTVSLSIEPPLRETIPAGTTVNIRLAKGTFRMQSDEVSWSTDHISKYGLSFAFEEVIL